MIEGVDFYKGCRSLLTDQGAMVVNLFGRSVKFDESYAKIVDAFGPNAVCAFRPTREGNTVVIALRTPGIPSKEILSRRAELIEELWQLPAKKWLKVLAL